MLKQSERTKKKEDLRSKGPNSNSIYPAFTHLSIFLLMANTNVATVILSNAGKAQK